MKNSIEKIDWKSIYQNQDIQESQIYQIDDNSPLKEFIFRIAVKSLGPKLYKVNIDRQIQLSDFYNYRTLVEKFFLFLSSYPWERESKSSRIEVWMQGQAYFISVIFEVERGVGLTEKQTSDIKEFSLFADHKPRVFSSQDNGLIGICIKLPEKKKLKRAELIQTIRDS